MQQHEKLVLLDQSKAFLSAPQWPNVMTDSIRSVVVEAINAYGAQVTATSQELYKQVTATEKEPQEIPIPDGPVKSLKVEK